MAFFKMNRQEQAAPQPPQAESASEQFDALRQDLDGLINKSEKVQSGIEALSEKPTATVDFQGLRRFVEGRRLAMPYLSSAHDWDNFLQRFKQDFTLAENTVNTLNSRFGEMNAEETQKRMEQAHLRLDRMLVNLENLETFFKGDKENLQEQEAGEQTKEQPVLILSEPLTPEGAMEELQESAQKLNQYISEFRDQKKVNELAQFLPTGEYRAFVQQMINLQAEEKAVKSYYKMYSEVPNPTPEQENFVLSKMETFDSRIRAMHGIAQRYIDIMNMETVEGEISSVDKVRDGFLDAGKRFERMHSKMMNMLSSDEVRFSIMMSGHPELKQVFNESVNPVPALLGDMFYERYKVTAQKLEQYDALPVEQKTDQMMEALTKEMQEAEAAVENYSIAKLRNMFHLVQQSKRMSDQFMEELRVNAALTPNPHENIFSEVEEVTDDMIIEEADIDDEII